MLEHGGKETEAKNREKILNNLMRAFELLFVAEGYSSADAEQMAEVATGRSPQTTSLPADLRERALPKGRIRERFRKMFLQAGETEVDAAAMADIAARGR